MSQQHPTKLKHFSDFFRVWQGQTLSAFGSQMTQFALGIWLFNKTGSVTLFGLVMIAQLLPAMLLMPVAGILVDKYSRRKLMLICEAGLFATSVYLYVLAQSERLDQYWIIAVSPLIAIFGVVHQLSYTASIGLLVTKPFYEKASALIQLGINSTAIVVPLISVIILDTFGIENVILSNIVCYLFSAYTLCRSKFSYRPEVASGDIKLKADNIWQQLSFGFDYVRRHGALRVILIAACCVTFLQGIVHVLFRPMLLIENSNDVVGWVVAIAGLGGFVGAVLAGSVCQRYPHSTVITWALAGCGMAMFLCGLSENIWLIGLLALLFSAGLPLIIVASQAMWLALIPSDHQGKVFATNAFSRGLAMLVAAATAPFLSSGVLQPLLFSEKNALLEFGIEVTALTPIQLVFLAVGALAMLVAGMVALSRRLRAFQLQQQFERLNTTAGADIVG